MSKHVFRRAEPSDPRLVATLRFRELSLHHAQYLALSLGCAGHRVPFGLCMVGAFFQCTCGGFGTVESFGISRGL